MADKTVNLVDMESQVKRTTSKKHQKEISLMAELLNVYTNGFNLVHSFERTEDNDVQYAWLLMIARSLHSMRSAILLMLSGYYGQALTLLRTVTEDWLIGKDCEHYKPTLDALLYEKHKFGDRKLKLRYIDMAQRVAVRDEIEDITYNSDYRFQSKFTHTGRLSIEVMRDSETNQLRVSPVYDNVLFLACCELLMRNGLRMNVLLAALLLSFSDGREKTWYTMVDPAVTEIGDWLRNLRQQYGDKDTITRESNPNV